MLKFFIGNAQTVTVIGLSKSTALKIINNLLDDFHFEVEFRC